MTESLPITWFFEMRIVQDLNQIGSFSPFSGSSDELFYQTLNYKVILTASQFKNTKTIDKIVYFFKPDKSWPFLACHLLQKSTGQRFVFSYENKNLSILNKMTIKTNHELFEYLKILAGLMCRYLILLLIEQFYQQHNCCVPCSLDLLFKVDFLFLQFYDSYCSLETYFLIGSTLNSSNT